MIDILFLTSIGFLSFAALHALLMAKAKERTLACITFALLCISVSLYQAFTLSYFHAETQAGMVTALRWQTAATLVGIWLLAVTASQLFALSKSLFIKLLGLANFIALVLNAVMPYGLRVGEISGTKPLALFGQQGSILELTPHANSYILHIIVWVMLGWVLYHFLKLPKELRAKNRAFTALFFSLATLSALTVFAIDTLGAEWLPPTGFIFIPLLAFISLDIAAEYNTRAQQLKKINRNLLREQERSKGHQTRAARLAQIFEQSPTATFVAAENGNIITFNQACENLFGLAPLQSNLNLLTLLKQIYPDNSIKVEEIHSKTPLTLPRVPVRQLPKAFSETLPFNMWLEFELCTTQSSTKADLLVVHCHDVTDDYYNQQAFEYIAKGVSIKSGQAFFDNMVKNLAQLFDAKIAFVGKLSSDKQWIHSLSDCVHGKISDSFSYALQDTPCANVMDTGICCYPSEVQKKFPEDPLLKEMGIDGYFGIPILDEHKEPIGILVVLDSKPVSPSNYLTRIMSIFSARAGAEIQRMEAEKQTRRVAYEDYLTQLPNRASANQKLSALLKQDSATCQLFMADLDQFKVINDALGHEMGDNILRAIGKKLRKELPEDLFIARVGGDEFAFINSNPDYQAEVLAEQILSVINQPLSLSEHLIDISASLGYENVQSCLCKDKEKCEALDVVRHAELALYRAKKDGSTQYVMYTPALESEAKDRMQLRAALKKAIEDDQLEMYFQPQVNHDGSCHGAEALVRWHDPELGFVSPDLFIAIAEESGLIHQLGHWVNERCFASLKAWLKQDLFKGYLSINISAWQFSLPKFADEFIQLVNAYELPAEQLCIELTETGLLADVDDTIFKLNTLREFGIRVALDDFGTGYSSLAYLRDLPIDVLKIDKAFIDELEKNERSPLTESMVAIGRNMNMTVVAEGVETESQIHQLEQLQCHVYQGYFYAKPMAEPDFINWIKKRAA